MAVPINVPTINLNNGLKMPTIGLGTLETPAENARQVIIDAIDRGYRYIDCAFVYDNEVEIGKGIQAKIDDGIVTRKELFIATKLWNTFHSRNEVIRICKEQLKNLNLTYLDLYLMHWPMGFKENTKEMVPIKNGKIEFSDIDYLETWEGMEICVFKGFTKSIGVCNFSTQQLSRLIKNCRIMPVVSQVECNPHMNQKDMRDICKKFNIIVVAYSPLEKITKYLSTTTTISLVDEPLFTILALKYRKSVVQIILRYLIQIGTVPLPQTINKHTMQEYIDLFNFILTREDMEKIDGLNKNFRYYKFSEAKDHPYYPYN